MDLRFRAIAISAILASALLSAQTPIQGHGFSFGLPVEFFQKNVQVRVEPKYTAQENGDQLPFGIGPARVRFVLKAKAPAAVRNKKEWTDSDSFIEVVPLKDSSVSDFKAAYPALAECEAELKKILNAASIPLSICENLPIWDFLDAFQMVHAHATVFRTPWVIGIQYLTQEVQEACPISEGRLVYRFIGISHDGQYLLNFTTPVTAPILPIKAQGLDSAPMPKVKAYCAKAEGILNSTPKGSFFPSLSALKSMVESFSQKK